MNILMLCDFFNEALEYQENLLLKYYRKAGHDVTVVTSTIDDVFDYYAPRHDPKWPERRYVVDGARIIKLRYRYNIAHRFRPFTSISGILEETAPDLIYAHSVIPNMLEGVAYMRRHPHCRMIMDFHADYSNSGKNWLSLRVLHGVARKRILDRARPHLSRIFPIIPASFTFLNEIYGVPMSEMELLPLGVDLDQIRNAATVDGGRAIRQRLGVPDGRCLVFTGGKLDRLKKTGVLFQALSLLGADAPLVVVVGKTAPGDDNYRAELQALAGGSPTPVHFAGWLAPADVYAHMAACDFAVFPRSQSVMWQQSIGSGLPLIVGTMAHQSHDYLNAHDNIRIVDGDTLTPDQLATAMRPLLRDPDLRRRMREGALRTGAELLDWNVLIEKTLRFVDAPPPSTAAI